ncbi:conserved protein of unknown function [Paenibacillus alvei]|uniref:Uncharacterized protein n=1 Tax=Paenibacillus alvei TaxID=44250 RepID=A0A383RCI3_PAEAL|nr:conserved protein of unknown function [Paenibacillus alvei]
MYFDCFTYIAKTEQLEAFQLHQKEREDRRRKWLEESCLLDEQENGTGSENG